MTLKANRPSRELVDIVAGLAGQVARQLRNMPLCGIRRWRTQPFAPTR